MGSYTTKPLTVTKAIKMRHLAILFSTDCTSLYTVTMKCLENAEVYDSYCHE